MLEDEDETLFMALLWVIDKGSGTILFGVIHAPFGMHLSLVGGGIV